MIKVLHIINNLGSGGAEKLLSDLVPRLNMAECIQADILLLTDKKNVFYDSLIKMNINISIIKYNNIYDPRNILEIKKHIVLGGYDIVHSHLFPTQYWVAFSKVLIKNKKIKFITTEHSTHNRRREKFYFRQIDKYVYSQFDLIVSISKKTKENLTKWIDSKHLDTNKHVVIENGVDIEKIKEAQPYNKSELIDGINKNIKLVCMVGRFSEAKDQPTLIRAISTLHENIHLVLIGEGPLINDNKKLARSLGILHRVHFLGFREDIPRILKTVDIVVLSSYWEGMSLACIEGLTSGKPFLASRVEGLLEFVKDEDMLFERGNVYKLSELIESIFTNLDFYNSLKYKCELKSKDYSLDKMVDKLLFFYMKNNLN